MSTTRRDFISTGAAAAAGLVLPPRAGPSFTRIVESTEPRPPATFAGRPVVVASDNALRGVKVAYDMLVKGADPLDAAIAGANIQELDPEDQSVGLGGLPNADGVVQLDASVMHGPTKRAGSVASLEDIATPSLVAKAVMDYTDHIMLVGAGARTSTPTTHCSTTAATPRSRSRCVHLRRRAPCRCFGRKGTRRTATSS